MASYAAGVIEIAIMAVKTKLMAALFLPITL